ncbi:MAG TPA: Uma2 family endonuclease [Roseiflexaceae bacterium]|nr:Uma2 family endonuclease [Roseiflexaceae bacterium]
MYPQAGGSRRHNLIVARLVAALYGQLRGRSCELFPSDMRVHVPGTHFYAYPDVSIACPPLRFGDQRQDTLLNPVVLIEVLSPSTENFDRGRKFRLYRQLDSFREYLLIAQDSLHVEHDVRQPDQQWLFVEHEDRAATIQLGAVGCVLALADIYERIEFDSAER